MTSCCDNVLYCDKMYSNRITRSETGEIGACESGPRGVRGPLLKQVTVSSVQRPLFARRDTSLRNARLGQYEVHNPQASGVRRQIHGNEPLL